MCGSCNTILNGLITTTGPELSCKDIVAMGSEAAEHDLRTVARGATRQAERARILQALQQQGAIGPRSPSFSGSAGPASTTSSAPMGCVTPRPALREALVFTPQYSFS